MASPIARLVSTSGSTNGTSSSRSLMPPEMPSPPIRCGLICTYWLEVEELVLVVWVRATRRVLPMSSEAFSAACVVPTRKYILVVVLPITRSAKSSLTAENPESVWIAGSRNTPAERACSNTTAHDSVT